MVLVTPIDSVYSRVQAEKTLSELSLKQKEVEDYLIRTGELVGVNLNEKYVYSSGHHKNNDGFFLDNTLKSNLDDYLVTAVAAKWDGIFLQTGMEGSGKTTMASAVAKYLDPTFPGELINDKTPRRHVDRIVFTAQQFSEAVAKSSPKQAIQFDEAILALMAGDAGMNIQKMLMKEITLIRKKQLYIVLVIPSIFAMRMPIAVQRSRFLLHTHSPDGIRRGYFKFYNYPTKRLLYMKGKRDYNQDAVEADFRGTFVNTESLFYDHNEYDKKKEGAIRSLTTDTFRKGDNGGLLYRTECQRNLLLHFVYELLEGNPKGREHIEYIVKLHNEHAMATHAHDKLNPRKFIEFLKDMFGEHLDISDGTVREWLKKGQEYASRPINPLEVKEPNIQPDI